MSAKLKEISAPAAFLDAFDGAVKLAAMGLPIFRLKPGSKLPFDADWAKGGATSDSFDVYDRFSEGAYNVGVLCNGLVVLDVDCKGAVNGFETLAKLGIELPATFTVRTASGGAHYYFRAAGFGQRRLGPAIDIRATRGYVVGPGSIVDGLPYVITNDAPIADLPADIAARLKSSRERQWPGDAAPAIGTVDTPRRRNAARRFIREQAPAVEGERNNGAYAIACRVMDFGVSPETALTLIEEWNDRCAPPLEAEELEAVVSSAGKCRNNPIGCDDPAEGFEPVRIGVDAAASVLEFPRELSIEKVAALQQRAIVKGLFLPGETGTVYGDSGAGKSFVALDLAFHVALGRQWSGRRVSHSPVLYVALEGVGGFQKRVIAATQQLGDPGDYFARLNLQVSLVKAKAGAEGAQKIIDGFKSLSELTGQTSGLIIVDTLARATAGDDENAVSDMMAFLEHRAQVIARETGAAVLIVHHTNKRGEERGSGSLRAGVDFALRVDRDGDRRNLTGEKVKDGVEGRLFDFRLELVMLGTDSDGDAITSCVVSKSDPALADRAKRCQAACLFLFEEEANKPERENVSPKKRAGSKYVANWIKASAPEWSVQEIEAAIFALTGTALEVEQYRTGPGERSGPYASRYILSRDAVSSGSVAVAAGSGSLSGKPQ